MAIAFDAASGSTDNSGAVTSLTWAHTCTGAARTLVVSVSISQLAAGTVSVTGVTYNAVAMTAANNADAVGATDRVRVYLYYLASPATGANNVVATISGVLGGSKQFAGVAQSYTGTKISGPLDSSGTNALTASTVTTFTLTDTVVSTSWLVGGASENVGDIAAGAAGSGTTYRGSAQFNLVGADSNDLVATGSQTLNYGRAGTSGDLAGVVMALLPNAANTITAAQGSYTYTGQAAIFRKGKTMIAAVGTFALTGIAATFTHFRRWVNESKNSSTFTPGTKQTTTWTNQTENSSTFTNQTKN